MASEPPVNSQLIANATGDELERALAELREVNERLIIAGIRMQELAEEAQEARKEAEAASHAKDEFLAALSHELRTPLNAILGWTHMLRRSAVKGPTAARALEIIERNAQLQVRLIGDLLQVSQIITGKLRLEVELTDLVPLIEETIDALRPAASAKAIGLQCHIEPGVRQVLADPARVQQIIWNLLSNAIKFTPRDGQIAVTFRQVGSTAEVSVRDSGAGIDPDLLPHVFERFRQGDGASHRGLGGIGLGLAIVRQLMELHGGSVTGESKGAGTGSTFTLTFPIPALAAIRGRIAPVVDSPSLQGLRVLVVEDEPDARDLIAALLSGNGAMVTAVTSVDEALAQLDGHAPDLMVADIGTDQDGGDLVRQVRALEHEDGNHVPAVALTSCARSEDRDRALAAGFQLHMAKPLEPDAFVHTLAGLVRRSRAS